jgi:predicted aminopeptidase
MRRTLLLSVCSLVLLLQGCYLVHVSEGQMSVMRKRQPIARVIADPSTQPTVKARLESVVAIRDFAISDLGLPDNGSYRNYADVGRPYVVWNVFAAPEFSVEPRRWCFPIAGCVAYRGYFNQQKAEKFALGLEARGYDVFVGGVAAYSTLGHFDDPVLNTMIGWSDVQLAAIIFHELSHQLIYVAGDSSFNEAFASVVEEEGVRRWLDRQGRAAELDNFESLRRRYLEFAMLFVGARERLARVYASGEPPERMRADKAAEFARLTAEYQQLRRHWDGRGSFDPWLAKGLNNAHLVSVATYQDCMPGFARLLAESKGDLATFYDRVRALTRLDLAGRHREVCEDSGVAVTKDR